MTDLDSARDMTDPKILLLFVFAWGVAAYLIVPRLWKLYFRQHPSLAELARVTQTSDGHPGDPINIAVVGSDAEVARAMTAAGWFPADPITLATSLRIAADTVLRRPDDDAPVSNLFLFSRKQDLAFEQPVGDSPRQRHHVRFWRWDKLYEDRTAWIGAATFDQSVGLSHTTGQVTHHIAPDVEQSVTSSQTNSIRRRWCSQSNGTTASTTSVKGAMAAVMLGTPMVA